MYSCMCAYEYVVGNILSSKVTKVSIRLVGEEQRQIDAGGMLGLLLFHLETKGSSV